MRVAIDAGSLTPHPTGVGRFIIELVRTLRREEKIEPVILGPDVPFWSEAADLRRIETPFLAGTAAARAYRLFFETFLLRGRLSAAGAEVYHGAAFRTPPRGAGIPTVATLHDLGAFDFPAGMGRLRLLSLKAQTRRAVREAAVITTMTRAIADDLVRRFPEASRKVRAIPLAVSPVFRQARSVESPPDPVFVSVSALTRRKNLARLLEAFSHLARRFPAARLRLIGHPEGDAAALRAQAASLGIAAAVRIEGYLDDAEVAAAYRGATALVYPSLYEGFGLPILEAMAAGAPVITSDRGAMREVSGDAARLVDPERSDAIAAAMVEIADSAALREDLRGRGLARAALFTWERVAAEYALVYRDALAQGSSAPA